MHSVFHRTEICSLFQSIIAGYNRLAQRFRIIKRNYMRDCQVIRSCNDNKSHFLRRFIIYLRGFVKAFLEVTYDKPFVYNVTQFDTTCSPEKKKGLQSVFYKRCTFETVLIRTFCSDPNILVLNKAIRI